MQIGVALRSRGRNYFGKHCSSPFFSTSVVPGQAMPLQSVFSHSMLSPQTKTGAKEVERTVHRHSAGILTVSP